MIDAGALAPTVAILGASALFLTRRSVGFAPLRLTVCLSTALLILRYFAWRAEHTLVALSLDFPSLWKNAFFALEAAAGLSSLVVILLLMRTRERSAEADANTEWLRARTVSVDIFIATYNEERDILERTIIGAKSQDHRGCRVFVLDDGRRPWLRELCVARGVGYLTREESAHAKAGNINNALETLSRDGTLAEFVAVLDADFVPHPNFVSRALTLFHDSKVGIVQTPQHFFNPDPIQQSFSAVDIMPDEQRFFFDVMLPAKDAWGIAFCCGTSSIARTEALRDIGGIPTGSITEDMLLTFKMKGFGWKTVYLNERLSIGLAPEGVAEFITQRGRWCIGFMQILRGEWGPFRANSLGLLDRISLLDAFLYWVTTFPFRLICLAVPVVFWLTGVSVINADINDLIFYLGPCIAAQIVTLAWISRGRVLPVLTDASQVLIATDLVKAAATGFFHPKNQRFKVTDKGGDRSRTRIQWRIGGKFAMGIAVIAGSVLYGQFHLETYHHKTDVLVSLLWSFYSMTVLTIAVLTCIELPRAREEEHATSEPCELIVGETMMQGQVVRLSSRTARIELTNAPSADEVQVRFEGSPHAFSARVVKFRERYCDVEFTVQDASRDQLIRRIFSGDYARRPSSLDAMAIYRRLVRSLVS